MSESARVKEQIALESLYADRQPFAPNVEDEEIKRELADDADGVSEALRDVMSQPLLRFFGRVESLLAGENRAEFTDAINELASFHPIYRAPYTQQLPGTERATSIDITDPSGYVRRNYQGMVIHNTEVGGWNSQMVVSSPPDLSPLMEASIASGEAILNDELWRLWTRTHELQDQHNYCTLGGLALNLSLRHKSSPFVDIEKHVIDTLLTHRNPVFLSIAAGNSGKRFNRLVLMPESTDGQDDGPRRRWLRAASVLATLMQQDPILEKDVDLALCNAEVISLIESRTMRGNDKPHNPLQSVIDGYGEAICNVLPGITAELMRPNPTPLNGEPRPSWDKALSEIISCRLASALTLRSPLGYGGPLTIQGVGLGEQPTERLANQRGQRHPGPYRRRITSEAGDVLEAMCKYWRREFHYKNFLNSKQSGTPPIRAGGQCPFSMPHKVKPLPPNLIEATQQVIFLLSRFIDPEIPEPVYDRDRGQPYRPSMAPDTAPVMQKAQTRLYRQLGLHAANQILAR